MGHSKILALVTMSLMLACSSDTDTGSTGGANKAASEGTVAMKDYAAKRDRAECERTQRCAKETGNGMAYSSVESCLLDAQQWTAETVGEFDVAIGLTDSGKVSYDAKQAAICVKTLRDLPCAVGLAGETAADRAACGHVFRGKTAPGGACDNRLECKDGWCKVTEGKEGCPGVCSPDAVQGEKCEKDSWCLGHLYCQNSVCGSFVAAKKGEFCIHDSECEAGLECPLSTLTCEPTLAKGATCEWGGDLNCDKGLLCTEGVCSQPRAVGEACTNLFGSPRCQPHLKCFGETDKKTCVVAKEIGADCTESVQCHGQDSYCGDGKCKVFPGIGQPCAHEKSIPTGGVCRMGLVCDAKDTCQLDPTDQLSDLGESCDPSAEGCKTPYVCAADKKVCVEVAPPSDCN
mgnify:CR=1 FL=1